MLLDLSNGLVDLLAAATPAPAPVDDDKVTPGVIGLVFLLVMGGAVAFLIRNMNSRLRNIDVDRHQREKDGKAGLPPREDDAGESAHT